jgi:chitinase
VGVSGLAGRRSPFRSEDGQNFTLLIQELRAAFARESAQGTRLYLTIAAGASDEFLAHTQMAEAQRYLDTVNLMSYDYYEPGSGSTTGHHAPLFTTPPTPRRSPPMPPYAHSKRLALPRASSLLACRSMVTRGARYRTREAGLRLL